MSLPADDKVTSQKQDIIRVSLFVKKRPDVSSEKFYDYWRNHHAHLFLNIPLVQSVALKYVQFHIDKSLYEGLPVTNWADYDGQTSIWFKSMEDVIAVLGNETFQNVVTPDAKNFIDVETLKMSFGRDVDFSFN